jgi:meiotically up-regulated gene 157 (Mug157) protein
MVDAKRAVAALVALGIALVATFAPARADEMENLHVGADAGTPIVVAPETLFHTLAADFFIQPDGTIYVQTGDIPAMWLRDSAAQMLPYVRLTRARPGLRTWVRGVIERDARNIVRDPYANAFKADYTLWERKWEVDSLAYPIELAWTYYETVRDRRIFTRSLHDELARIVDTYACEQHHDTCSSYRFTSLPSGGRGFAAVETGMIWSGFRASDDPTVYPYNIPEQMLAVTALQELADLAEAGYGDRPLALRAIGIEDSVRRGVARYGTTYDFRKHGWLYAYEVDGRGNVTLMDDANLPSLLSAPLTGYLATTNPLYRATRAFVLSRDNPFFFEGRYATGEGSPHTPAGYVWPLAIAAQALTDDDPVAVRHDLAVLATTDGDDGLIHESFDPNDYRTYTRAEFGWANAMFAELLFRAAAGFPAEPIPDERGPISWPRRSTYRIVDDVQFLTNRGLLLRAFERVIPIAMTEADS